MQLNNVMRQPPEVIIALAIFEHFKQRGGIPAGVRWEQLDPGSQQDLIAGGMVAVGMLRTQGYSV